MVAAAVSDGAERAVRPKTIHGSCRTWWRAAKCHPRHTARSAGNGRRISTRPRRSGSRSDHDDDDVDVGEIAAGAAAMFLASYLASIYALYSSN
jgi:hypothetical protein